MNRKNFLAVAAYNTIANSKNLVAEYCNWAECYSPEDGRKYREASEGLTSTGYCEVGGGHVHFCTRPAKRGLVEVFLVEETKYDSRLFKLALVEKEYAAVVKQGFFLAYE